MIMPKIKLTAQQKKILDAYKDGYKKGFGEGYKKGQKNIIDKLRGERL